MATLTKSDIAALSVDERLTLIDDLWESFEEPETVFSIPDWHKEELDRRLDDDRQSTEASIPWEEVKAELYRKYVR